LPTTRLVPKDVRYIGIVWSMLCFPATLANMPRTVLSHSWKIPRTRGVRFPVKGASCRRKIHKGTSRVALPRVKYRQHFDHIDADTINQDMVGMDHAYPCPWNTPRAIEERM
jgi:hypothetical protein